MQIQPNDKARHLSDITGSVKETILGSVELPCLVNTCMRGKATASAMRGKETPVISTLIAVVTNLPLNVYPPKDYGQASRYTKVTEEKNITPCGTPDGSE